MRRVFCFLLICIPAILSARSGGDSPWLYGIHWYGSTDRITTGQLTDAEEMTGKKGVWVLDQILLDAASHKAPWDLPWQANPLDKAKPGDKFYHAVKVMQGKGHSIVWRVQPYWSRNVIHPSDPYTLPMYADDCKAAATMLRDWSHIWQIGNEVNLTGENKHWDQTTGTYSAHWNPTPADYAATYEACRDKIHEVKPNTPLGAQLVLMQPNSPGPAEGERFMDSNEYLWRQIGGVSDKSKIDGFGMHSYADPRKLSDDYVEGFMDGIREQLMVIDELGLGDRPVFITEWNKHMPTDSDAEAAARFLHRAYECMDAWNRGKGGEYPGLSNHNVVSAMWFVYPSDKGGTWESFSLFDKKRPDGGTPENDPWRSFQFACTKNYPKGRIGGGPKPPRDRMYWRDSFDGTELDTTPPLPDWEAQADNGGSVVMSGDGAVRLLGNDTNFGAAAIRTAGYVYGNLRLEADITLVDTQPIAKAECNAEVRVREGSRGYSLTLFPDKSNDRPNKICLRRVNEWSVLKSIDVPDGIKAGDSFHITAIADGPKLGFKVTRTTGSVVLDWTGANSVTDEGQKVGWVRLSSYNLKEARVSDFQIGGPDWKGSSGAEQKPAAKPRRKG